MTIAMMGVLMGIAISTWQGVIESREADSAMNRLASDLRLAHTQATNRLETVDVVLNENDSAYDVGNRGGNLQDDMRVLGTDEETITFNPEGDVDPGEDEIDIEVGADGGDPSRTMEINTATSRVEVDT